MKIKYIVSAFALMMTMGLVACGDEDSENPITPPKEEEKGPGEVEAGCNFQKSDNVWKYKYSSWGYVDVYTWVDETTVKYELYAKSYHMEKDDTTYTDVNRDEFYLKVLGDCEFYQGQE